MLHYCGPRPGPTTPDPVDPGHQDLLASIQDVCPGEPEDMDGFKDDDGCLDPDNDEDRIPDSKDLCPNDPEIYNNVQDEDGCPDMTCQLKIQATVFMGSKLVVFDEGSADLPDGQLQVMDDVASVMKLEDSPVKLLVLGHADFGEADPDHGLKLSKARASAVAG